MPYAVGGGGAWHLVLTPRQDASEVYQTYSYGTLLWPRLFNDDIPLGTLPIL